MAEINKFDQADIVRMRNAAETLEAALFLEVFPTKIRDAVIQGIACLNAMADQVERAVDAR